MNATCDACEYDGSLVRASLRRTLAQCDDCGRTLCDKCLMEMAVASGMLSESDANLIIDQDGANGLLLRCEESGDTICTECFGKESE